MSARDTSGSAPQHSHTHKTTMSRNEKFWFDQVTVPHPPPLGNDKGWGTTRGGGGCVCSTTLRDPNPYGCFYRGEHKRQAWTQTNSIPDPSPTYNLQQTSGLKCVGVYNLPFRHYTPLRTLNHGSCARLCTLGIGGAASSRGFCHYSHALPRNNHCCSSKFCTVNCALKNVLKTTSVNRRLPCAVFAG